MDGSSSGIGRLKLIRGFSGIAFGALSLGGIAAIGVGVQIVTASPAAAAQQYCDGGLQDVTANGSLGNITVSGDDVNNYPIHVQLVENSNGWYYNTQAAYNHTSGSTGGDTSGAYTAKLWEYKGGTLYTDVCNVGDNF